MPYAIPVITAAAPLMLLSGGLSAQSLGAGGGTGFHGPSVAAEVLAGAGTPLYQPMEQANLRARQLPRSRPKKSRVVGAR